MAIPPSPPRALAHALLARSSAKPPAEADA